MKFEIVLLAEIAQVEKKGVRMKAAPYVSRSTVALECAVINLKVPVDS
jgi:hypothetical protein